MQNFLRAYACKKLVRTANYGFASKWSGGGEAVWIPGRKGGGRRGVIGAAPPPTLSGDLKRFTQLPRKCHQDDFSQ